MCEKCAKEYCNRRKRTIDDETKLPSPIGCERCGKVITSNLSNDGVEQALSIIQGYLNNPNDSHTNERFARQLLLLVQKEVG